MSKVGEKGNLLRGYWSQMYAVRDYIVISFSLFCFEILATLVEDWKIAIEKVRFAAMFSYRLVEKKNITNSISL